MNNQRLHQFLGYLRQKAHIINSQTLTAWVLSKQNETTLSLTKLRGHTNAPHSLMSDFSVQTMGSS